MQSSHKRGLADPVDRTDPLGTNRPTDADAADSSISFSKRHRERAISPHRCERVSATRTTTLRCVDTASPPRRRCAKSAKVAYAVRGRKPIVNQIAAHGAAPDRPNARSLHAPLASSVAALSAEVLLGSLPLVPRWRSHRLKPGLQTPCGRVPAGVPGLDGHGVARPKRPIRPSHADAENLSLVPIARNLRMATRSR